MAAAAPRTSKACWNPDCNHKSSDGDADESSSIKLLRCSRCQVARYCSRECQVANWKLHKKDCKSLQTSKCDKDLNKQDKKLNESVNASMSSMADSMAEMLAGSARRMAANQTDPGKRAVMERFSQQMFEAVAEEKEKKSQPGYRAPEFDHKAMASALSSDESFRGPMVEQIEKVMKMQTGDDGKMLSREEMARRHPEMRGSFKYETIISYMGTWRDVDPPTSFQDMLDRVDPVLAALVEVRQKLGGSFDDVKFRKLVQDVDTMKRVPESERSSYSLANLETIQKKWSKMVNTIFTEVMSASRSKYAASLAAGLS